MNKICKIALFVLCAQAYSAQAATWQEFGQAVNEVSDGVEKLANNYKDIKAENQNCTTDKTKLAQDAEQMQAQLAQAQAELDKEKQKALQAQQDAQTQLAQAQQDAQEQIERLTQEKQKNSAGLDNAIEKIKAVTKIAEDALNNDPIDAQSSGSSENNKVVSNGGNDSDNESTVSSKDNI